MSVIGIAGCTALIVIGFGIKYSVSPLASEQYGNMWIYDGVVNYKDDLTTTTKKQAQDDFKGQSQVKSTMGIYNKTITIDQQMVTVDDLQFGVHIQRHVRTRRQQRFVVKQSAHVAVQTDIRLLHPVDLTAEIIRNTDDAIRFRAAHQFFRLFHISRPRHDFYIGRSIDPADKVAAESRIRPIDHHRRDFPDRFSRINKSIEQGIKYRYQNKKDQYSLVTHHATGFLTPYKKRITDSLTE